jgi:hypothetical protein
LLKAGESGGKTMTTSREDQRGRPGVQRRSSLLLIAGAFAELLGNHKNAAASSGISGSPLADVKVLGLSHQVRAIEHRDGSYRVTTADGRVAFFAEPNLHFKVDSSFLGPHRGTPALLPAGTMGDRAWMLFAAPGEIGSFITEG